MSCSACKAPVSYKYVAKPKTLTRPTVYAYTFGCSSQTERLSGWNVAIQILCHQRVCLIHVEVTHVMARHAVIHLSLWTAPYEISSCFLNNILCMNNKMIPSADAFWAFRRSHPLKTASSTDSRECLLAVPKRVKNHIGIQRGDGPPALRGWCRWDSQRRWQET